MRLSVSPKLLGSVLAWAVRLWHLTLRVRRVNVDVFMDPGLRAQRPVVILWHDEIFPLIPFHEGESMACVVSQSRDGELLAEVLRRFGFLTVRGSSSRGGMRALVAAKRVMDEKGWESSSLWTARAVRVTRSSPAPFFWLPTPGLPLFRCGPSWGGPRSSIGPGTNSSCPGHFPPAPSYTAPPCISPCPETIRVSWTGSACM